MRKLKLYIETSVWNFVFDEDSPNEMEITKNFFDSVRQGNYEIFISEVVIREIENASENRRKSLAELIKDISPIELLLTAEADELANLYLEHGIVPRAKIDDARHISIATDHEMDAVITWNYRHLANLRKAELFNAINLERGYTKRLEIVTPMEVSQYED